MPRVRSRDRFLEDNLTEGTTPSDGTLTVEQPTPIIICEISGEELESADAFNIGGHLIHNRYIDTHVIQDDTGELAASDDSIRISDEGVWVSEDCETYRCSACDTTTRTENNLEDGGHICCDCRDNNFFQCESCDLRANNDSCISTADGDQICSSCERRHYFTCEECGEVYHDDYDTGDNICEGCRENIDEEEDGDVSAKPVSITKADSDINTGSCNGSRVKGCPYDKGRTNAQIGKKQRASALSEKTLEFLDERYGGDNGFTHVYKHKAIKEEFDIVVDKQSQRDIQRYFDEIKHRQSQSRYMSEATQQKNKYRNFKVEKLDGDKIKYTTTTIFGKKKNVAEPAATTFKYMEKLSEKVNDGFSKAMFIKDSNFKVVMSNEQDHKIEMLQKNHVFGTCQTESNCKDNDSDGEVGYARGAFDLVANGCNAPILIYDGDKLQGRILGRFMYDGEGKEFLFIDRLYSTGALVEDKKEVYSKVISIFIDKGYNIIVSNSSAHDDSVYGYLKKNKSEDLKFTSHSDVLRQPVRKKQGSEYYGYYSDSGTRCYANEEGYIYDVACMEKFLITK